MKRYRTMRDDSDDRSGGRTAILKGEAGGEGGRERRKRGNRKSVENIFFRSYKLLT